MSRDAAGIFSPDGLSAVDAKKFADMDGERKEVLAMWTTELSA
jgi:uncharacterized membrane protein YdbT with pleckstrin-like domain